MSDPAPEARAIPAVEEPAAAPEPSPERGAARRRRRQRRRRRTLLVVALVIVVLGGCIGWYEFQANPLGAEGKKVVFFVHQGDSAGGVIDRLASDGVISSSFAFRLSELIHGTPTVIPGGYLFHQNQSFSTVRAILSGGPDVFTLSVDPGLTLAEVAKRLSGLPIALKGSFSKELTSGAVSSPFAPPGSGSLEGSVAPGQYLVVPGERATHLLQEMVGRFTKSADSLDLSAAASSLGVTPAQLLVVASIVQKEGVYQKNMGKVARVIYNRLADGTPLQMDSTVLYSLGQDGGPVTAADLALKTPYNTYLHTGLPPTAICTPSRAALEAAAHPTPGSWLYFVLVSKDGTEQFSDTYAEQLAAEQLAQSRGLP